jgi:enamine deaminase RidA (YjgF/YER057c/UK114 family)
MPHPRHRLHNVRDQHPERSIVSEMCSVVVSGERIFVRGQTGFDMHPTARRFHGAGDPAAQAEQAMRNVAQLLGEVGARLEHICKVKVWVTDRDFLPAVMAVVQRHLEGIWPVYTELVVDGLARAELQMEVDVEVVVPPEDRHAIRVPPQAPLGY